MKKLLFSAALLALLAAPAMAYVQGGQILEDNANKAADAPKDVNGGSVQLRRWMDGAPVPPAPTIEPVYTPLGEAPSRPIPEPGTMILASLGLLALGASRARRRGR